MIIYLAYQEEQVEEISKEQVLGRPNLRPIDQFLKLQSNLVDPYF
jgi:hypothetical protein